MERNIPLVALAGLSVLAAAAFCQAPPPGSGDQTITGFVRVIDGDTLDVWIGGHETAVGLIGFDAPSANTPCGKQAANALRALVRSGLRLEEDLSLTFDERKRRMYYPITPAGLDIALEMVSTGFARAVPQGRAAAALASAEAEARRLAKGCLWQPAGSPAAAEPAKTADPEVVVSAGALSAATLPTGFSEQVVASGFTEPTNFAFLPDGRILVTEKHGVVKVIKNGAVLPTPFIDLSSQVNDYWDHGLLGIAVDPGFATNGFVYLLYTYENDPLNYEGPKTGRLIRVTASGDTASPSTQVVILGTQVGAGCGVFPAGADCISSDEPSHSVGNIRFAPDGSMFVTTGDGASFNVVDDNALRAQNLDSLTGKLLHITSSGAGISTNPFWNGSASANRSKVWGYGLRNPFRFTIRPSNGVPYLGDVGWSTWEEINVGVKGGNFGWPCYEGAGQQPGYSGKSVCQALYAQGSSAVVAPLVAWEHAGASAAALGGTFYTGTSYPAAYQGAYFYGDYSQSFFRTLTTDASDVLVGTPQNFATGTAGPVALHSGPNGDLYYSAFGAGEIRRIFFTAGNTPPTAAASATPTSGVAPLSVQFSSSGSSDPDGDPITFSWNFGDGSAASTAPNPQHTYSANGTYTAVLTVSDNRGGTATASVVITVGNRAPAAAITAPLATTTFKVGDVITFSGSATDPEDGNLTGASLTWQINLQHCVDVGVSCHTHAFTSATGSGGSFTVPDHGDYSYFQIVLTAKDSGGLTDSKTVEIRPQRVNITLATSPTGLQVSLGAQSGAAPFTRSITVGATTTITALSPQTLGGTSYTFASWSDGGAMQHNVVAGTGNATYTATFTAGAPATAIRVNAGGPAYTDPQGRVWNADTNFTGGSTYSDTGPIANTTQPNLYQSERWSSAPFSYDFAVANGDYTVTLKFAEIFFTSAGSRVFNVSINGTPVLTNFDIVAAAGAGRTAVDRSFPVSVTGGRITITFTGVVQNPKISAIEIVAGASAPPGVSVAVSPKTVSLGPSQTQQFTASVTGATNTAVTWSLSPAVGTISGSGLYTAPSTISSTQSVTVTATSAADTTKSDTATITLNPPGGALTTIRVNAGGPAFTDSQGRVWSADTGFTGGNPFDGGGTVGNTTTPVLYQTERWSQAPFAYDFAVANGNYLVTLKFAEIFFTSAGSRVFNVAINNQPVLTNFDVFAAAGGFRLAVDRSFPVSVTGGRIRIDFSNVVENPKISAIEIVPATGVTVAVTPKSASLGPSQTQQFSASVTGSTNTAVTWSISPQVGTISSTGLYTAPSSITSSQSVTVTATSAADSTRSDAAFVTLNPPAGTATVLRVNAGGPAYTDPAGQTWSADTGFLGGSTYNSPGAIANTTTPDLYQTERWGSGGFSYDFPVANGTYTVTLKFAEIFFTSAGSRVFNVSINGAQVLSNFDIFAAGGARTAVDRSFPVSVTGGRIRIDFTGVVENPKISAIEIR